MSVCLTKTEIIAGSVDGTVRTFDILNGRNCVLASCLDSTIRLSDRYNKQIPSLEMETTALAVGRIALSVSGILIVAPTSKHTNPMVVRDNAKLCSCGGDRQVFYWDVSTGRVIRKFRGHESEVNSVKFNDYDSVIVSAGYDQSVRAWDCRSHSTEPIQIIDTFQDSVMSVCLTKTEIIAGSVDGTVRTFDIRNGRELVDNLGHAVNCISLSNDRNCVLASCLDSTIRLSDRTSGELLQEYKGHICKSFKTDCCLTNTDAHVIGGSEDGMIFFWDLVDASVVASFRAHNSVVTSVSYHPNECFMLTSSVDSTVRLWKS